MKEFLIENRMTTFYNGDCLEVMKELSDNSVDCFICDLPYGQLSAPHGVIPLGHKERCPQGAGCDWDVKIDLVAFWDQVKRLAKDDHTPVLMFCNTKFGIDLINSNPSWFRYDLVWDKGRGVSFLLANKMPMKSHEMIYVFSKKGAFYRRVDEDAPGKKKRTDNTETPRSDNVYHTSLTCSTGADEGKKCVFSVIQMKKVRTVKDCHPTEKPEELYEWLLRRYVPDNGVVLDPTAGSFNSCFAADRLGYTAIGIEKDEAFYENAVKRLNPE